VAVGALAGKERRCGLGELSADAGSDSILSLLSEDIADDMVLLGMIKTIVLFVVVISAPTSSVVEGPRPLEIVRRPSCTFASSLLEPGRRNVPVTKWD
jgi:hypothetical protein